MIDDELTMLHLDVTMFDFKLFLHDVITDHSSLGNLKPK